jgi:hypothetical protein
VVSRFMWSRQGTFDGPSKHIEPDAQRADWNLQTACPLGHASRLSIQYQESVASTIAGLFGGRRPSAVVWEVAQFIVLAFNGVLFGRPWANVSKERREIVPALTNRNPAATVVFERPISRIQASNSHHLPAPIFRRAFFAVRPNHRLEPFEVQAATAFRAALFFEGCRPVRSVRCRNRTGTTTSVGCRFCVE